jgi:SAM-dependent methyltransferase
MPTCAPTYCFENAWEHAQGRLRSLERLYDPGSIRRLEALGIGPGWRCLEVGAGGGSITRWLCSKVAASGRVLAVDVDTRFVGELRAANLDVARLDVTADELPRDSYDLVHVRAVLSHLPAREEVLASLVAALAPRGWLLLEEPDAYATDALGAGVHAQMLNRCNAAIASAGFDPTWARDLPARLTGLGLAEVGAESDVPIFQGGSVGAEFFRLTALQIRDRAIEAGATAEQLDEWVRTLAEPDRWFPGYAFVAAWGRRR